MPAVAWVTVAVSTLIIGVTAVGLIRVIWHLKTVQTTLVTLTGGVRVVADQTRTVPEALTSVNASLKPVRDFCESV
jgi:uncharacterized protein YoxC